MNLRHLATGSALALLLPGLAACTSNSPSGSTDEGGDPGPTVSGTSEALAMVMSGRPAYLDRIGGDGAATVRERLGG